MAAIQESFGLESTVLCFDDCPVRSKPGSTCQASRKTKSLSHMPAMYFPGNSDCVRRAMPAIAGSVSST